MLMLMISVITLSKIKIALSVFPQLTQHLLHRVVHASALLQGVARRRRRRGWGSKMLSCNEIVVVVVVEE